MAPRVDAAGAWAELAASGERIVPRFDPSTLDGLPAAAQRLLRRALPAGTPLQDSVVLHMRGEIHLNRWLPFRADEVVRAGEGFVWRPVVGWRLLRVTGADVLHRGRAVVDFRLHGVLPVARAAGAGVDRSAAGRLAAETVAWLPQALTPQRGARWRPIDGPGAGDAEAVVVLDVGGRSHEVRVSVDPDGALRGLCLQRWRADADPPQLEAFGGCVDDELVTGTGARIAGVGTVGWGWSTPDWDGGTFRYRITEAHHGPPGDGP